MNKLKHLFTIISLFFLLFFLFRFNYLLKISVLNASELWLTKVFPSLFIMFILNDIIISSGLLTPLINFLNPFFNKIFKTSNNASEAFILSLFSGTPASGFIIKELWQKGKIDIESANKLISFTYFSNPLFLYNILSFTFNKFITFKIIIIHYLSNIVVGLIYRGGKSPNNYYHNSNTYNNNLFLLLPNAIKKSLNTMLMILGTIIFYMIITNILTIIIPFNHNMQIIFKGLLEITQCLNVIGTLTSPSIIKELIAIAIISFGGLSIHTQILSIINDTPIKYTNFLKGRIYHVLISTITYWLIFYVIPG